MTPRQAALAFVQRFCAADLAGLEELLAPDLLFDGPLLHSHSAGDYLQALANDPPEQAPFRIDRVCVEARAVMVQWTWRKPSGDLSLQQRFTFKNSLIRSIRLDFRSPLGPANQG